MSTPEAVFSATLKLTVVEPNTGALLVGALVVALFESDQALVSSALVARTCTS